MGNVGILHFKLIWTFHWDWQKLPPMIILVFI